MKPLVHALFGLVLGLAVWKVADLRLGILAFGMHVIPLIDIALKKWKIEPFHTFWAWLVFTNMALAIDKMTAIIVGTSYALHLILDVLVPEGIAFYWPISKKKVKYVIPHTETIIIDISLIGLIAAFLWYL